MDSALVMDVLEQALSLYGIPEIFNTNQGSQYTSGIHTQRLKNKRIIISIDGICIERIYLNEYGSIDDLQK